MACDQLAGKNETSMVYKSDYFTGNGQCDLFECSMWTQLTISGLRPEDIWGHELFDRRVDTNFNFQQRAPQFFCVLIGVYPDKGDLVTVQ